MARCNNCNGDAVNSVNVQEQDSSRPWAIWSVERVGSLVALKSDNGKYLTKCTNCWERGIHPDSAFATADAATGSSLWITIYIDNGKWAVKGDKGRFLSRVLNCVSELD